jgi:hypothetical protein
MTLEHLEYLSTTKQGIWVQIPPISLTGLNSDIVTTLKYDVIPKLGYCFKDNDVLVVSNIKETDGANTFPICNTIRFVLDNEKWVLFLYEDNTPKIAVIVPKESLIKREI